MAKHHDEPDSSRETPEKASGTTRGDRMQGKSEYDVGYGKPPKAHQFQPGRSGNLKGRRKRVPTVNEQIQTLMLQKVTVSEGGERKQMTRQEVMLRSIVNNALKGDLKAANFLLGVQNSHRDNSSAAIDPAKLNEESRALLQEYTRQLQTGEEIAPSTDLETGPRVDAHVPEEATRDREAHSEADTENSVPAATMPTQPIVAPVVVSASATGSTQSPSTAPADQATRSVIIASAPVVNVVRAMSSGTPQRPSDVPSPPRSTPPTPHSIPPSATSAPQTLATA
jgi:hypothetical protein